jgi:glycosyltransferase involved in cell wall biosynthesis
MGRNPGRNWRLSIAGPPGTEDFQRETRQLIRDLEVEDRVEWVGFLPDRAELFKRCDLLAMPSHYEGFGMVAGEALCNALPVVVPQRTGVAEIVEEFDAGIVMPEASVEELEKALVTMDDDPEARCRFSGNGIKAANSRLSFDAYAAATGALYSSLVSERGSLRAS